MNTQSAYKPFLPSDRVKARDSLVRAAAVHFIAEARGGTTSPDAIAAKMFGNDAVAPAIADLHEVLTIIEETATLEPGKWWTSGRAPRGSRKSGRGGRAKG